jgi:hypothetical protein
MKSGMAEQFPTAKTGPMLNSGMVCCRGFMPESKFGKGTQQNKKHCPRRIEAAATSIAAICSKRRRFFKDR